MLIQIPKLSKIRPLEGNAIILEKNIFHLETLITKPISQHWQYLEYAFASNQKVLHFPWNISNVIREVIQSFSTESKEDIFQSKGTLFKRLSRKEAKALYKKYSENIEIKEDNKIIIWNGPLDVVYELKAVIPHRQDWYAIVYEFSYDWEAYKKKQTRSILFKRFVEGNIPNLSITDQDRIYDIFNDLNGYFSHKAHTRDGSYNKGYNEEEFVLKINIFFELIELLCPVLPAINIRNYLDTIVDKYEK